jgi:hypothetical protein
MKQQSSILVYRLQTKENKLPFSLSVCSKQTEVCRFHFPFAANIRKLSFSIYTYIYDAVQYKYCMYIRKTELYIYIQYICAENGTKGKQQLLFVCCKWKTDLYIYLYLRYRFKRETENRNRDYSL